MVEAHKKQIRIASKNFKHNLFGQKLYLGKMKFLISLGAGCKKEKELQAVRKVLSSCWQKRIYLGFQKGVVRYH